MAIMELLPQPPVHIFSISIIIIITRLPVGVWFMRPIICACVCACFKEMQSMTIKEMQSITLRKSTISSSKMQKEGYKRTHK
jgi:hypothetical protein